MGFNNPPLFSLFSHILTDFLGSLTALHAARAPARILGSSSSLRICHDGCCLNITVLNFDINVQAHQLCAVSCYQHLTEEPFQLLLMISSEEQDSAACDTQQCYRSMTEQLRGDPYCCVAYKLG